jgi:choline/glycine/proline betaine transport protein
VSKTEQLEFSYEIRLRNYTLPGYAYPEINRADEAEETHYYRAEVFLRRGSQSYDVYGYEQADLIGDILDHFERYLQFLHTSPGILPWNMEAHSDEDLPPQVAEQTAKPTEK